jgi:gliding motility-associated-like protein
MFSTRSLCQQLFPTVIFCLFLNVAGAQFLQVTGAGTPPYTPQNLVSNVFLGDGVDVISVTYSGSNVAIGYFEGGLPSIGLDRGIVMTTGRAESNGAISLGCNEVGSDFASNDNGILTNDIDLESLTTAPLHDLAEYTITFVPTSDTLRFRYCFGSEEYPEYACSAYNDVFGFFIQGPGYPTPTNIAIIPNTTLPVAINNLHPANPLYSNCNALNAQYYHNNNMSNNQPSYDGYTSVFTAMAVVTPCQQYTIKLAIADAQDGIYDSGVFLEAKSFGTGSLHVAVATPTADGTVTEGCTQGAITFSLPNPSNQNTPIDYHIWGTATNGVDYQNIPTNLFIPAGQTKITIPVIAFEDHLTEAPEYIAVDVKRDPCHRDTVYLYIRDNGLVPPQLRPDTTICAGGAPLKLDGTLPITLPGPATFSYNTVATIPTKTTPLLAPINVFGVSPLTLGPGVIKSVCVNITHNWDDDLYMYLLTPGGQVMELSSHNGGNGHNYTNTCFMPNASVKINFPGPYAPSTAAPFTGDWLPQGLWTDLYGNYPTNGQWKLSIVDKATGFTGTLDNWSITFEPSYQVNYKWSPAVGLDCPTCPVANATPNANTVYSVIATDSYGCTVVDTVAINVNPALAAPQVSCGTVTGTTITFNWAAVPGSTGYEVNVNGTGWVPASGGLSHMVTGLTAGSSVTIQVRGISASFSCTANIGTGTCVTCEAPVTTPNIQGVTCFGGNTGTVKLVPDGINPPYTFKLGNTTNTTGMFQNLTAGNYTATVTDASGCSQVLPVNVPTPGQLIATTSVVQNVTCFGSTNGVANVVATGGTGAQSYKWSDPTGQTAPNAANLAAGIYTVTVTDGNGCTTVSTASITQPPVLAVSTTSVAAKCFNDATGSLTAAGNGGIPPFTYAWNNGPTTALNANIPAGGYTVTVTDGNGCAKAAFSTVGQPTQLAATTSSVNVGCHGGNSGSATVNPSGGTSAYSYLWNTTPPQTTATASGLTAQSYSVTITDAHGCTLTKTYSLTEPPALVLSVAKTDAKCKGNYDGTATVTATGGVGTVKYKWSDPTGQTSQTAKNLAAGTYTVTVTDANNCTTTVTVALTEPQAVQLSANVSDASCFGKTDGKITTSIQGGTSPYSWTWNTGANSANLANQPSGDYTVTMTDANGCSTTLTKTIGQTPEIVSTATPVPVRCFGNATGALSLNLSGGTPGYTVAWTGPTGYSGTGASINGLFAGNYTAIITDAKGCIQTQTAQIDQPASALALVLPAVSDTICFQATDGAATVNASGGTGPYNYLWSMAGQTGASITNLLSAPYTVTVTDAQGCSQSTTTFIAQKAQLFAVTGFQNPHCHNGDDGTAHLTAVFYGLDPANQNLFNYSWSTNPVQHKPVATGLKALTTYTVTITDSQGCTATQDVTVGNNGLFSPAVNAVNQVKCYGDNNGSAAVKGVGGAQPYSYLWSPGPTVQTDSLAQGLSTGTFRVTITDAFGCSVDTSVTITSPPPVKLELQATDVLCYGDQSGSATSLPSGGVPPYSYSWGNGVAMPTVANLAAGQAFLTITDQNGCSKSASVAIGQPSGPLRGSTGEVDPSCFGGHDGKVTFAAHGGTPPYRYALDNQPWNGSGIQIGIGAGTYTPHVIDHNGCLMDLEPITVKQPDKIELDLGPTITILLGQDTQLVAVVKNGQGAITYAWNPRDSTWLSCLNCQDPFVDSLYFSRYFNLRVKDSKGCVAEDNVLINVEKPRRIFVPTGFTPNGDGQNDALYVLGQSSAIVLKFQVFDRWGELIYEYRNSQVNDPVMGWDGTFRGKMMDPGVYVWVVEAKYMDGETEVLKGNTTLIR